MPLVRISAADVAAPAAQALAAAPNGSGGGALSAGWVAMLLAAVIALRKQRTP